MHLLPDFFQGSERLILESNNFKVFFSVFEAYFCSIRNEKEIYSPLNIKIWGPDFVQDSICFLARIFSQVGGC